MTFDGLLFVCCAADFKSANWTFRILQLLRISGFRKNWVKAKNKTEVVKKVGQFLFYKGQNW